MLKECPMRHENGNCLPAGGFCTAVREVVCEALQNAYQMGYMDMGCEAKKEIKSGKWVITKTQFGEDVTCPYCKARPRRAEYGYYLRDNFCPQCGAKLEGGEDEQK